MRQRNDTPFEVHAWVDPMLVIGPGKEVEWDNPLTGMTVLDNVVDQTLDNTVAEPIEEATDAATPSVDEEPSA